MFTVSECDLISNTLTSHDSAPIRGRPTLKDAERFRTGSIIHESTINSRDCQKCDKSITEIKNTTEIKSITEIKSTTEIKSITEIKSTTEMTNNTQTNI